MMMMNSFSQTLIMALIAALIISISSANGIAEFKTQVGVRRFLVGQKKKVGGSSYYYNMTCDKLPRVCRLKNISGGPDCCKNKCVNVKSDKMNCGKCGNKCKYSEMCCKGKCVNASYDRRNCGACNNKCNKGEFCVYGMCNYA